MFSKENIVYPYLIHLWKIYIKKKRKEKIHVACEVLPQLIYANAKKHSGPKRFWILKPHFKI